MADWTQRLSPQARRLLRPVPEAPNAGPTLSRAQRRFAYLEQLHPGLYHSGRLWEVPSDLNLERLQDALDQVVERHPILLTGIAGEKQAERILLENRRFAGTGEMDEFLQERLVLPFDGPLLWGALCELPVQRFLFLKTHHAISDYSSRMALGNELAQLCQGLQPPRPSWSYADFTRWENHWLSSPESERQRDFWRRKLSGATPIPWGPRRDLSGSRLQRDGIGQSSFASRLAVLFILLWNRTAATDLCVGITVSLRNRPELVGLVGCLINTVLVRVQVDPDQPFQTFLEGVRRASAEGVEHSQLPFEEAAPGRSDLCTVMLNDLSAGPTCPWPSRRCQAPLAHQALSFTFSQGRLELEYADSLLRPPTAHRWLELYALLLEATARQPRASLQTLADAATGNVLTRIERQVSQQPQAVAVRSPSGSRSYAELWQRSEQLASRLQLTPGQPVALRLGRQLELPESMLAVWRAGGSVLLLEPGLPEGRLQAMLEAVPGAAPFPGCSQASNERVAVSGAQTAYVMFTSGSSGRPKGIALSHANLSHFLEAIESLQWGPVHTLMATALSFDISLLEILYPLTSGGSCYAPEWQGPFELERLRQAIELSRCTFLQLTPSVWRLLFQSGWRPHPGLERALSGGEKLDSEVCALLLEHIPQSWNAYGPTEATIWISAEAIGPDSAATLGQPFPGAVFALEGEELIVGGPQLARAYLNADNGAFSEGPAGQPRYRTGDRVHRREDGRYRYLGRLDGQLKIRGTRVEPAEVESVLSRLCQGDAAVVVPHPRGDSLVAFVFGATRDLSELPHHLHGAALPAEVRFLERMPLNRNGKLDRAALLAELERPVAPASCRDDLEQRLLQLWRDQLGCQELGPEDDFFACGGHSLAAAQLVLSLQQALGVQPPLGQLLSHPTPRQFATCLRARGDTPWPSLVPFQKGPMQPGQIPFFCVHPQGASVLLYQKLAALMPGWLVFCGLDPLPDPLDIDQKGRRYAEEIRRFWPDGPYLLGGLSSGGTLAYATAQHLDPVRLVVPIDTVLPGHFTRRPRTRLDRLRALLFHLSNLLFHCQSQERPDYLKQMVSRWLRPAPPPPRRAPRPAYTLPQSQIPVTLLRASHRNQGGADPAPGWRTLTPNLSVLPIRGFHGTDLVELAPLVRGLAKQLVLAVVQALPTGSGGAAAAGPVPRQTPNAPDTPAHS